MTSARVKAPIILVHGLLGFGQMKVGNFALNYFRGIPEALSADQNIVPRPPQLPLTGTIANQAQVLKDFLTSDATVAGRPVHLIAHSMGGLASRHMISRLGMASRVLSLTTVGTPHRGTVLADNGVRVSKPLIEVLGAMGMDVGAFENLTSESCKKFNDETPDAANVRYCSVAGVYEPPPLDLNPLRITWKTVKEKEGDNDGQVSVTSAAWGHVHPNWPGDHINLINWGSFPLVARQPKENYPEHYRDLVRHLAAQGF